MAMALQPELTDCHIYTLDPDCLHVQAKPVTHNAYLCTIAMLVNVV